MTEDVSPYDVFSATAETFGDRPFLHIPAIAAKKYSSVPIDFTYSAAKAEIENLRRVYANAGFGCGHRVALALENRADFFLHWLALNALGASVVPVNVEQSEQDIAYTIGHSDAVLVVILPEHEGKFSHALEAANPRIQVVRIDRFETLAPLESPKSAEAITPDTECALLYTSGSTGAPKGCILSNEYFTAMGTWYARLGGLCALAPGVERLATPLPLSHMNAFACSTMGMIATGGCIIQLDRFHPKTWLNTIKESGATVIHYLGVIPAMLLTLEPEPSDKDHCLKFGFGAGVNPKYHAAFEARFGFPLVEGWAMTETGSGGCIMANREPRHVGTASFGRPPPEIEVKIVDYEGVETETGVPGELLVRAAGDSPRKGFFSGYYKDEEATAKVWWGNWLHTGDIVKRGPDGSLQFVDRIKNIIRRSGENISCLEVETVIGAHPDIKAVVVAPVIDDIRGDEVMAVIMLKDHRDPGECLAIDIFEHAQSALSYYKLPGYISFVDALPLTASQKPKRGEMRKFSEALIRDGKAFDLRERKRPPKNLAVKA